MTPHLPVKAIAFDCFDTLVEIGSPEKVFKEIVMLLPAELRSGAIRSVMSNPWSLDECIHNLGVTPEASTHAQWRARLESELKSISCFEETVRVLTELKRRGYRIAVCSNLALPYAAPVERLLGSLFDVRAWSFALGSIKPDSEIYAGLCDRLELPVSRILMVGDSYGADYAAPRAMGLHARHLTRGATAVHGASISSLDGILGLVE